MRLYFRPESGISTLLHPLGAWKKGPQAPRDGAQARHIVPPPLVETNGLLSFRRILLFLDGRRTALFQEHPPGRTALSPAEAEKSPAVVGFHQGNPAPDRRVGTRDLLVNLLAHEGLPFSLPGTGKIGRASCRERV